MLEEFFPRNSGPFIILDHFLENILHLGRHLWVARKFEALAIKKLFDIISQVKDTSSWKRSFTIQCLIKNDSQRPNVTLRRVFDV